MDKFIKNRYKGQDGWLVVVLAPTGLAAYNFNGQTMHRFFKLPIFKDADETHWGLSDNVLKSIRPYLLNVKLFIIGLLI